MLHGVTRLGGQARRLLSVILDAVLPLRERSARTARRTLQDIPLTPTTHKLLGVHITTLMNYRDDAVQDLIRALKYEGSHHAASLAAEVLADYLREEFAARRLFNSRRIRIVPIPLHKSRRRMRGFNQIELVVRALPPEFRELVAPQMLLRSRATAPQTRLPRRARLKNVEGAFATAEDVTRAHVYLIDDVTTTGATLMHAGRALRAAGAEVTLLALARA